jgi:hypothetical protein
MGTLKSVSIVKTMGTLKSVQNGRIKTVASLVYLSTDPGQ